MKLSVSRRVCFLLTAAFLLIVEVGCDEPARETVSPFAPDTSASSDLVVEGMEVRMYSHSTGWSGWSTIPSDTLSVDMPDEECVVMQFRQGDFTSSLAGFDYPELDTCFVMPDGVLGNSVWRVTYSNAYQQWPAAGRIEFRWYETHVTQVESRTMFYMAERYDADVGAYVASSPWFGVRMLPSVSEYVPHQDGGAR